MWEQGEYEETLCLPFQFCCEPKTAHKNSLIYTQREKRESKKEKRESPLREKVQKQKEMRTFKSQMRTFKSQIRIFKSQDGPVASSYSVLK